MNNNTSSPSAFCKLCKKPGHFMDDCTHFERQCTNCNTFGHDESTCRFKKINKKYKSGKSPNSRHRGKRRHTERENAHQSKETTHIEEEVVFQTTELNDKSLIDGEKYYNFDTDVVDYENDEHLIYYNCLADTATTSHVSNHWDAFTTFEPSEKTMVGGVGGIKTHAKGRGTVQLKSTCDGQKYILTLQDVLYIPGNKNNLISLGCWEAAGGKYTSCEGMLMLTTESGNPIAKGP